MAFLRVAVLALLCMLGSAFGQGIPAFHTVQNNESDIVELSTLNVMVSPEIRKKSGGLSVAQNINSLPYYMSGNAVVGDAKLGVPFSTGTATTCTGGATTFAYTNFTYKDRSGVVHAFPGAKTDSAKCLSQVLTATTNDGSGYTIVLVAGKDYNSAKVYDAGGGLHTNGAVGSTVTTTYTDPNGNTITEVCTPSSCVYTDVYGTTALTLGSGNTYTYTDAAGNPQTVTVNAPISPQLIQSPCNSSGTNGVFYPLSIAYPDGSALQLTWEPKAGTSDITGRLASIKLRSGATISYSYSGGTGGVNCSDFSTATMTRQTPDGTWMYAHTAPVSGSHVSTTRVTAPAGNYSIYTFASGYEIYHQSFSSGGTLLATKGTCYNGAVANCSSQTVVNLPITQIDQYSYVPGVANPSSVKSTYNTLGLLTKSVIADFGGGVVSSITTNYGSYSGGSCVAIGANISNRPCQIIRADATGTTLEQTNNTYDARGNLLSSARLVGLNSFFTPVYLTSSATYNANGSVASRTDVNGQVTTFSNFVCNGLLAQTNTQPQGLISSRTWDCNGGVVTFSNDSNGASVTNNYVVNSVADPLWRPLGVTDTYGNFTSDYYEPNSTYPSAAPAIGSFMNFNGGVSQVGKISYHDSMGRVRTKQTFQQPGSLTSLDTKSFTYDTNGRLATQSVPCVVGDNGTCSASPGISYTYDGLNRPLTVTDSGSGTATFSYNANDVLVTIGPAPAGEHTKQRQYEYNGLGQLVSVCEITNASGSGPCGQRNTTGLNFSTGYVTLYTYTPMGKLSGVTQGAQRRSFVYDGLGRVTSETNPENGTTTYTYDSAGAGFSSSAGDLVKKTDANGNWTSFFYDSLHRLTDVGNNLQGAANPCKRFRYDNSSNGLVTAPAGSTLSNVSGRVVEAETDNCTVPAVPITNEWFSYSGRGEVTDIYESTPHSGGYFHTTAAYWANGVVQQLGGIGRQATFSYGVDSEGRPYSATQGTNQFVTGVTYTPGQQELTVSFGNGDSDNYAYDANTGRILNYTLTVGATPKSIVGGLTWNPNGTLRQLQSTDGFNASGAQTCAFGYDDIDRIASDNCGTAWSQNFSYDQFGNITKSGSSSWMPGYSATTNRYQLAGTTYDADGNLLNDTFHSYTWSVYGRPATIDTTGFTYDAFNHMVEKSVGSVFTEVEYSPVGKACTMNGQTTQIQCYVPLPGGAVFSPSPDTLWHRDALGSIRLGSLFGARTVTFDRAFAPFGELYQTVQGGTANPEFAGLTQESVTGEYDTPNRQLHPGQGRWISPDPAGRMSASKGSPQSWNRYAYANNNPLLFGDMSGLDPDETEDTDPYLDSFNPDDGYDGSQGSEEIPDAPSSAPCLQDASCGADIPDSGSFSLTFDGTNNASVPGTNNVQPDDSGTGSASASDNFGQGEAFQPGTPAWAAFQGSAPLWNNAAGTMNAVTAVYGAVSVAILAGPEGTIQIALAIGGDLDRQRIESARSAEANAILTEPIIAGDPDSQLSSFSRDWIKYRNSPEWSAPKSVKGTPNMSVSGGMNEGFGGEQNPAQFGAVLRGGKIGIEEFLIDGTPMFEGW